MLDINTMNIDSKKVYALVRVSSDKQDFDSQMQGISNYCKNNNIELLEDHIIQEHNVSGFNTVHVENMYGMFAGCKSLNHITCKQSFKDWCWKYQNSIGLPTAMREGGTGTWTIVG